MNCKICNTNANFIFTHQVLKKYEVSYFHCPKCFFVQPESPYWIDEAYRNALNEEDTGLIKRNEYFREKVAVLNYFIQGKSGKYLDFAGGYGIFTRMMRDCGFNYLWLDKYATNIMAKGFEGNQNSQYDGVTAFEVFEHLLDPKDELGSMLKLSNTIIFSTVLIGEKAPDISWWYYGFNHGQHVSIYSEESLIQLGKQFGLYFYTNHSNFHMFSRNKISNFYFYILIKLSKYGLYSIIKLLMKSKTDSDAKLLLNK